MQITKCDICGKEDARFWRLNLIPPELFEPTIIMDMCEDCAKPMREHLLQQGQWRRVLK